LERKHLEKAGEVLQWYLDFNSGGVVHTEEELKKVRELLESEKVVVRPRRKAQSEIFIASTIIGGVVCGGNRGIDFPKVLL